MSDTQTLLPHQRRRSTSTKLPSAQQFPIHDKDRDVYPPHSAGAKPLPRKPQAGRPGTLRAIAGLIALGVGAYWVWGKL